MLPRKRTGLPVVSTSALVTTAQIKQLLLELNPVRSLLAIAITLITQQELYKDSLHLRG